jgi:hypothetical protein
MTIHDVAGIGAPYDLQLPVPADAPLVRLVPPIAVRFVVLEGKSARGAIEAGTLVALSSRVGRLRVERPLAAMENLKLELAEDGLPQVAIWGKTIASDAGSCDVWFVALPDELRGVLEARTRR